MLWHTLGRFIRGYRSTDKNDLLGQIDAIHKSQAVIEFDLNGHILMANQNFLDTTGYSLEEIQGRHHRMFIDPDERGSPQYAAFWERLGQGHMIPAVIGGFAKMARTSGCRRRTTPSLTSADGR